LLVSKCNLVPLRRATTHEQFAQKLYTQLKDSKRFLKPKRSMTVGGLYKLNCMPELSGLYLG
jgi:hypothetical protein